MVSNLPSSASRATGAEVYLQRGSLHTHCMPPGCERNVKHIKHGCIKHTMMIYSVTRMLAQPSETETSRFYFYGSGAQSRVGLG